MIPEMISLLLRLLRQQLSRFTIDYHLSPLNLEVPSMVIVNARDFELKDSLILTSMLSYDPSKLRFPPSPNQVAIFLNCYKKPAQSQESSFQSVPPYLQKVSNSYLPPSSKSTAIIKHLNLHLNFLFNIPTKSKDSEKLPKEMRSTVEQIITWQNYHWRILPA